MAAQLRFGRAFLLILGVAVVLGCPSKSPPPPFDMRVHAKQVVTKAFHEDLDFKLVQFKAQYSTEGTVDKTTMSVTFSKNALHGVNNVDTVEAFWDPAHDHFTLMLWTPHLSSSSTANAEMGDAKAPPLRVVAEGSLNLTITFNINKDHPKNFKVVSLITKYYSTHLAPGHGGLREESIALSPSFVEAHRKMFEKQLGRKDGEFEAFLRAKIMALSFSH